MSEGKVERVWVCPDCGVSGMEGTCTSCNPVEPDKWPERIPYVPESSLTEQQQKAESLFWEAGLEWGREREALESSLTEFREALEKITNRYCEKPWKIARAALADSQEAGE